MSVISLDAEYCGVDSYFSFDILFSNCCFRYSSAQSVKSFLTIKNPVFLWRCSRNVAVGPMSRA